MLRCSTVQVTTLADILKRRSTTFLTLLLAVAVILADTLHAIHRPYQCFKCFFIIRSYQGMAMYLI